MGQYRKRPVVIEAIQYTGENKREVLEFTHFSAYTTTEQRMVIQTLEGNHICSPGDWVIKGVAGEFYPCKPDIFEVTYESVAPEHKHDET